ncbi:hypothetical protein ANN_09596 [Periplaneta americana]|uniref:Uncharacterized protein n=1 Tax=Periplaneta americana TaxID=6978 RepID=A0ABQ8TPQ7_PERAM|nr:hypothetical protein ANN_09596 [Periplaneta americana]
MVVSYASFLRPRNHKPLDRTLVGFRVDIFMWVEGKCLSEQMLIPKSKAHIDAPYAEFSTLQPVNTIRRRRLARLAVLDTGGGGGGNSSSQLAPPSPGGGIPTSPSTPGPSQLNEIGL